MGFRWIVTCYLAIAMAQTERRPIKEINYTIPENISDTRKLVGDLIHDAGLRKVYDASVVGMLQFEFLSKSKYHSFFSVEHTSGLLYTSKQIDREAICPYLVECKMSLDIVVQPFQFFQIIKVKISILDLNDDFPSFPDQNIILRLSEGTRPERAFPIPAADDMDSPRNGIKEYRLETDTDLFKLEETKTRSGDTKLQLVLKGRLDREIQDTYNLRVIAEDGGFPSKTGTLTIQVKIGDINDNVPVFENATYTLKVQEGLPKQSVLVQVHATDLDEGLNGRVIYKFSKRTNATVGHVFGIRNRTGDIYLVGPLDYEQKKSYHLSVIAHDMSHDPLYAYADVSIYVEDINDHEPEIIVNSFTSSGVAKISEWAEKNELVAHVAISDKDSHENGKFNCFVSDRNFILRKIVSKEYGLYTHGSFDREVKRSYNVTISCRDKGTPQLSSAVTVRISVDDENDNYPTFVGNPYVAQLEENNDIGASIIRLTATDKDMNDNGLVKYKLDGNYDNLIDIEPKTGTVRARQTFDYEQTSNLEFSVIAFDQGIPSRSATAAVSLNIINVNDQPPKFQQTSYMFAIAENQPVNSEVGQLAAVDLDKAPYNAFTFSLVTNLDANYFYIDPKSGAIKTRRTLDRENRKAHDLLAMVKDQGVPSMTSTASVRIIVQDKNDNPPVVEFPNPANYTVNIPASIPTGYEVSKIRANDADEGDNAKISFYILEQTPEGMFSIDPWTGVITMDSLPAIQDEYFTVNLKVQVKDNGEPPNSVDTALKVVLDKTIPYVPKPSTSIKGIFIQSNAFVLILCVVVSISVILILALVIAIICVRRRRMRFLHHDYQYCGPVTAEVKPGGYMDRIRAPPSYDDFLTTATLDSGTGWSTATKPRNENLPSDNSAILYFQSEELLRKYLPQDGSGPNQGESGNFLDDTPCCSGAFSPSEMESLQGAPGAEFGTSSGIGTEVLERATMQINTRDLEPISSLPGQGAPLGQGQGRPGSSKTPQGPCQTDGCFPLTAAQAAALVSDYANLEDIRPHHGVLKKSPSTSATMDHGHMKSCGPTKGQGGGQSKGATSSGHHKGTYGTSSGHPRGTSGRSSGHPKDPSGTVGPHKGASGTVGPHKGTSGTVGSHKGTSGTVGHPKGSSGTVGPQKATSGTVGHSKGTSGAPRASGNPGGHQRGASMSSSSGHVKGPSSGSGCPDKMRHLDFQTDTEESLRPDDDDMHLGGAKHKKDSKKDGPIPRPRNLKPKSMHRKGEHKQLKEMGDAKMVCSGSLPDDLADRAHRGGKGERQVRDHRRHRHRRHGQSRREQQDNITNEAYEKNRLSVGTSSSDTLPREPAPEKGKDKQKPLGPIPVPPVVPPENIPSATRAPTEGAEHPPPPDLKPTLSLLGPEFFPGHEDSSDQSETRIHNGQKSQSSDSDIGVCGISHRSIEV